MFLCAKPSKRVAQGGRHLSFEQSLLSKEVNIDTRVEQLSICDGTDDFLSSAGRKVRALVRRCKNGSNHDVTAVLAFERFSLLLCPFLS